jgi:hypothetical protein
VETVWVEAVYGPVPESDPTLEPTLKSDHLNSQCPNTCDICYDNPRQTLRPKRGPLISEGRYEFRYADGDRELVTFADGSQPNPKDNGDGDGLAN